MKIAQFILIDKDASTTFNPGKTYTYTVSDQWIYPIGKVMPIIRRGVDCIGLGKVIQFTVSEDTTKVAFSTLGKLSNASKDAYYNLYRQVSTGGSDMYDSDDAMIPGAIGLRGKKSSEPKPSRGKDPISDFLNDLW